MRFVGRIVEWNDERGFGFVVPNGGGDRCFVHVSATDRGQARPALGALVSYEPVRDSKGRLNATTIRHVGTVSMPAVASKPARWRRSLVVTFLLALLIGTVLGKVSLLILIVYALASGLTVIVYALDKSAARRGQQRTPENSLHLLAILGGWPGALIAQDLLRHKSRKAAFQAPFWFTVFANLALLFWLVAGDKLAAIETMIFGASAFGG